MARHEVTIHGFFYNERNKHTHKHEAEAGIIVQPPVVVGELFTRAVLGTDASEVTLRHVLSTAEHTIFIAHAGDDHARRTEEAALGAISLIASRIKNLAENPENIAGFMKDNPFPDKPRQTLSHA